MNWLVCAALVVLVAASSSFGTAEARMWRCRRPEFPWAQSTSACLFDTDPDVKGLVETVRWLILTDPTVIEIILTIWPDANFDKINETITRIMRVWCTDVDVNNGGVSGQYEFDDNVEPMCQTMLYRLELKAAGLELGARLLARGPWGYKGSNVDEQNSRDCYKMCKLFVDGATVSIAGLRARPTYLGCSLKESGNGEPIRLNMEVNKIDCEGWNPNRQTGGGGGGSPVGWILVGLVALAIVVIIGGVAAFWFFKIRTPSAPSASTLAESFAPSINLSKA